MFMARKSAFNNWNITGTISALRYACIYYYRSKLHIQDKLQDTAIMSVEKRSNTVRWIDGINFVENDGFDFQLQDISRRRRILHAPVEDADGALFFGDHNDDRISLEC